MTKRKYVRRKKRRKRRVQKGGIGASLIVELIKGGAKELVSSTIKDAAKGTAKEIGKEVVKGGVTSLFDKIKNKFKRKKAKEITEISRRRIEPTQRYVRMPRQYYDKRYYQRPPVAMAQTGAGKIDIHELLGKLPRPKSGWVLPKHKYTGPYNPLSEQLDESGKPKKGQEPYNQVDEIAMKHDVCYGKFPNGKNNCDRKMLKRLKRVKSTNTREAFDRALTRAVIGAKYKLNL